jgi:hypothetical protein
VKIRKKKIEQDDWCNDCMVCTAMRIAEKTGKYPSVQELEVIFAKQNLKNKLNEKKS